MRLAILRSVAAVLACAAPLAWAVDVAPIQKTNRPIVIEHDSGQKINAIFARVVAGQVTWVTLPDDHFVRGETQTIFAAPAGDYLITAGDSSIVKIVDEDSPNPKPEPPPPNPGPDDDEEDQDQDQDEEDDDPGPPPKKLKINWAVWVEEIDDRGKYVKETNVMLDAGFRAFLRDRDAKFTTYDDDQTSDNAKAFIRIAGDVRPALVLVESEETYLVIPAPKTVEDAKAIFRRHAIR